jgi:hypothetical protein
MEVGTRRILNCNVTAHPTAEWTLQRFREAISCDHLYRFLIRDRDSIFSAQVDEQLNAFGLRVLRTPVRARQANAYCERLVGTVRRECLDFMVPLGEKHLGKILAEWVRHYNQGRPHSSLGPGIPESSEGTLSAVCLDQTDFLYHGERESLHHNLVGQWCKWRLAGSRRRPERRHLRRERRWCRWPIAKRRVRPPGVVLYPPLLDHDLRLLQ